MLINQSLYQWIYITYIKITLCDIVMQVGYDQIGTGCSSRLIGRSTTILMSWSIRSTLLDGRKKKIKVRGRKGGFWWKGESKSTMHRMSLSHQTCTWTHQGWFKYTVRSSSPSGYKVRACNRRLKQDERNVTAHTHRHTNTHIYMTRCPLRLREEMLGAYTERLCLCWRIGNGRLRTIRNIPRSCCFLIENHHEKACLCRHDRDCFVVYVCWFPFER